MQARGASLDDALDRSGGILHMQEIPNLATGRGLNGASRADGFHNIGDELFGIVSRPIGSKEPEPGRSTAESLQGVIAGFSFGSSVLMKGLAGELGSQSDALNAIFGLRSQAD